MECTSCHCKQLVYNEDLLATICTNCGTIINDATLINENTFTEQAKVGCPTFDLLLHNNLISSNNGKLTKIINSIILRLNLPKHFLDRTKRYYNCCINKSFTKGRSLLLIVTTILYTLCRIEKIHYLLIDFSDISRINLYRLAACYLDFINLFDLELPVIDPSFFIRRFCMKLDIVDNDQLNNIVRIALKVIQCMKKDWITDGRNPSGLCGAAISISLLLNGYQPNLEIISDIVKMNKETIQKRINEFKDTDYSKMTKEEFDTFDNFANVSERDPPIFIKNQLKEKEKENKLDLVKYTSQSLYGCDSLTKCGSCISLNKENNEEGLDQKRKESDEELSDLSDNECEEYIENPERYKIKKALWEEKNKDWLREQGYKKKYDKPLLRRKRRVEKVNEVKYKNVKDAILHNEKILKMRIKSKVSFMNEILSNIDCNKTEHIS